MNTILKIAVCVFIFTGWSVAATDGGDLESRIVVIDNLNVHYVESGTGQAVVLIHGDPGGVEDFELGAIDQISKNYRVIAIDRPGHGGSDRPEHMDASVVYQATLLHATLASLGITRPVIVGHSWGGSLALAYAIKYPGELAGMVLLAPSAYPDSGNFLVRMAVRVPFFGDLAFWASKSVFSRGLLKRDLARAFYPQPVPEKYFKAVFTSWLRRKQLKAFFADEDSLNDSLKEMKTQYAQIKTRTVIVIGDQDMIVSKKDNAYKLQKTIRGSRLIELKNAGHEIPQTHPESIVAALKLIPIS